MANDQWFYSTNGQKNGPVTGAVLKQLARSGELSVGDLLWREGMAEWAPASKVKGLFPENVVAVTPPPLPASPLAVAVTPATNLDQRYSSIYCSSDQKILLGLGGGLAHKFGLPPAAMRVILFFVPFGIVAYIAAFFLPKLPTKGVPRPA
jgi:phage shock protein PspC (stress-responsive transcriptional regulator)